VLPRLAAHRRRPHALGEQGERERRHRLGLTLVRGNHDRWAQDPPRELGIEVVEPGWTLGGISMHHEPPEGEPAGPSLCGHIHPAVSLRGRGKRGAGGVRAACFWFSDQLGVLPAFGSFTGCATVRPREGDHLFAVGDGAIVEIKPA
ncbi:MAG: hypothetical protein K8E66_02250, partial [Phycisphaerales bacterium]|nr:hypothetical protein [Phycisphaerales bacterium]